MAPKQSVIVKVLIILILQAGLLLSQKRAIFSYNPSFGMNSELQDSVILTDIDIQLKIAPEESMARSEGGWGLSTYKTAHFQSDSSSIISVENATISYFGNHDISGELWLKPDSLDGALMSWGNPDGPHFITIFLEDGYLNIHRLLSDSLYVLKSDTPVDSSSWSYIYWFSRVLNGYIEQNILINSHSIGSKNELLSAPAGFVVISSKVTVGFPASDVYPVGNYTGEMMGINLNNYIRSEDYYKSSLNFDGSEYFGMPLFNERGDDKLVETSKTPVLETAFIPYLNDYFIPQGLASTFEDKNYSGENPFLYLTMYHKTVNGYIGYEKSILVEIDINNDYKVRRCFSLSGTIQFGHLPSAAYYGGNIYIGSEGDIYRCPIPDYETFPEKYQEITYDKSYDLYSSTMDFFDDTLWVGKWGDYGTDERAYIYGYPMAENGDIITNVAPKIYQVPNTNQGAGWTRYGGKKYLFVSTSWGGTYNSKLHRFRKDRLQKYELVEADTIFEVPSGGEDITFDSDGNMFNVSESGSRTYQTRTYSSPWNQFYPFIFKIAPKDLFPDVDTTFTGIQNRSDIIVPKSIHLSTYPNPFNNEMTIQYSIDKNAYVGMDIFDIGGKKVKTLLSDTISAGDHQFSWNAQNIAGGIYFINVRVDNQNVLTRKITYLR